MKVYDCITYCGEDLLLKIRFETLFNKVDKFVIVEANRYFNGDSKPKLFNIKNFDKFKEKIDFYYIDDLPKFNGNNLYYEYFIKDQIKRGLNNLNPDDIVLISDADEIPNLENEKYKRGGNGRKSRCLKRSNHASSLYPIPRSCFDIHRVCICQNDHLHHVRLCRSAGRRLCGTDHRTGQQRRIGMGGGTLGLDPAFPHSSELEFWKHSTRRGRHGLGPSHRRNRCGWLQCVGPCLWGGI